MTDHSRGSGIHAGMSKGFEEFRRHHRVAPLHFVGMNRNHHDIRLPLRLADLSHCPFQVDGKRLRLIPLRIRFKIIQLEIHSSERHRAFRVR